jgi:transcriptional regulator with XRE-family HTH domain
MPSEMSFHVLQLRVIADVQERVRRGDVTERGLARLTGISQPHLHNILKGARVLSPHMADLILRQLHINLLDLLEPEESAARHLPADRR